MRLVHSSSKRGSRAALLAGAAAVLLGTAAPALAQKTDPLEEEAAQAQRRMRALRDLDRMIREAESARLRGQCKTVAQIHSYFHGTFEGLPAGVMEFIERLRERIDAIAADECPPGSGKPSVQPPAAQPDPPPTNGQAGAVPVPPPPVGTTGTQPPAGTGQATPPTGAAPAESEPSENIMDEIDELDRLEWERRKAAREARLKAEAEASGASTTTTPPPKTAAPGSQAQGLTAADDRALAENLEEAGRIEDSVRDIEGDEWLHQDVRAGVLKRVRENLLQDKRFPPESIQRWVERLDRVWESLPPEAKAEAEKPLGPVRSTTLPLKLPPMPPPSTGPQSSVPLNRQEQTFLALHNQARAEVGAPPLQWDPLLAASAKAYAIELTSAGQLVHSSREGRKTVRENLLQNLPGGRTPSQMIGVWTAEKSKFKPGIFPDVSTTGNWYDIGHYTQMVWETTTHVGCAINGDARYEWLVCHYSPPGNRDGTAIGLPSAPQPRHMVGDRPPKVGGGMTQIDPPPPTARDNAPDGDEARHPLNGFFAEAFIRHSAAIECGDQAAAAAEMAKMRYALDELKKRLKAAKEAGPFSMVKPDDVQQQIDDMQTKIRSAELRRRPGACPPMPMPRGVAGQTR